MERRSLLGPEARDAGPGIANLPEILEGRYRSRTGVLGVMVRVNTKPSRCIGQLVFMGE